MSIFIGADICPRENCFELFTNSKTDELLGGELSKLLQESDFNIFNLECPLADKSSPIKKLGTNFMAPESCAQGLKSMRVDLVTLANNHIKDQDVEGIKSTIESLKNQGIDYVGAGSSLSEAKKLYCHSIYGKTIGIYACTEHEFSIATDSSPGANPFDPLESLDHIQRAKAKTDYLIVLYHGGIEHYRYPSPNLQKTCRKIVEKGADLVVCQHSHCIGCREQYLNGIIIYGQGNFISTSKHDYECWKTSILIELTEGFDIKYIPLKKDGYGVRLATDNEAVIIIHDFEKRSNEIKADGFVNDCYKRFADDRLPNYVLSIAGIDTRILYRLINKISLGRFGSYLTRKIKQRRSMFLRNYVECEAHRELLLKGLE